MMMEQENVVLLEGLIKKSLEGFSAKIEAKLNEFDRRLNQFEKQIHQLRIIALSTSSYINSSTNVGAGGGSRIRGGTLKNSGGLAGGSLGASAGAAVAAGMSGISSKDRNAANAPYRHSVQPEWFRDGSDSRLDELMSADFKTPPLPSSKAPPPPFSNSSGQTSGKSRRVMVGVWRNSLSIPHGFLDNTDDAKAKKIVLIQSLYRRRLALKLKKIAKIEGEIISTEESYIQTLGLLIRPLRNDVLIPSVNSLLKPLTTSTAGVGLNMDEINILFPIVLEWLYNEHKTFLIHLKEAPVGQIHFVFQSSKADFLYRYSEYVNNYNHSIGLSQKLLESNPAFERYVKNCERRPECKLQDLFSLLIAPVQRIPRYVMLLQDIKKYSYSKDNNPAQAITKLAYIAEFVNEEKRNRENLEKITSIQSRLSNSKNLNLRKSRYIREGIVYQKVQTAYNSTKMHSFLLFLFHDVFLIAKEKVDEKRRLTQKVTASYPVAAEYLHYNVISKEYVACITDVNTISCDDEKHSYEYFEVITSKKRYILGVASFKEKEDWITDFRNLISK